MKVLNVAEKPSIAKSLSKILSHPNTFSSRPGRNKYNANFSFPYKWQGQDVDMVMTSVLGHLMELDFNSECKNWRSTELEVLFTAEIVKSVKPENEKVAANIKAEARTASHLIIWTDCDREGESIGHEIASIAQQSNPRIKIYRARYSAINAREIHSACQNPSTLDMNQVNAVDVRMELDLRLGAIFTRLQTMFIKDRFGLGKGEVVSYGGCQFPTLGFVVDQFMRRKNFIPEDFWYLTVTAKGVKFTWTVGHLFDRLCTFGFYQICMQSPQATVTKVNTQPQTKYRPIPLRTVEMQKFASSYLKIPSDVTMNVIFRQFYSN